MRRNADSSNYVDFDEFIEYQLRRARGGIHQTDVLIGLAVLGLVVLGYLFLFVVCDHWLIPGGFNNSTRLLLLLLLAGFSIAWSLTRIVQPLLRQINVLYAAREIERAFPELKNTLLTWVELRDAGRTIPPEIRAAIEKRAAREISHKDVDDAVDRQQLLKTAYALLAVVALFCIYTFASPKSVSSSIWRALFPGSAVQVATRTEILAVLPGDTEVPARLQLDVSASLGGVIPPEVMLYYSTADRRFVDEPLTMRRDEKDPQKFNGLLAGENGRGLLQDLTYYVVAGDARSATYRVRVNQPPSATVTEVEYSYPAYMGLVSGLQAGSTIDAWEGTTVTVFATANVPLKSAVLVLTDTDDLSLPGEEIPVRITEGTQLAATWQLKFRSDGTYARYYHLQVRDERGQTDPLPAVHVIQIRPDKPPEIALLQPTGDLQAPANAIIPLAYRAHDPDFLLRRITLRFEKQGEALPEIPTLYEGPPYESATQGTFRLDLSRYHLRPGDRLTYFLEAEDNMEPFADRLGNKRRTPKLHIDIIEPAAPEQVQQELEQQERAAEEKLQQTTDTPGDAQPAEDAAGMDQRPSGTPPESGEQPPPGTQPPADGTPPANTPSRPSPSSNDQSGSGGRGPGESGNPQPAGAENGPSGNTSEMPAQQPSPEGTDPAGKPGMNDTPGAAPQPGSETQPNSDPNPAGNNQPGSDNRSADNQSGENRPATANEKSPQQNADPSRSGAEPSREGNRSGAQPNTGAESRERNNKAADDEALRELLNQYGRNDESSENRQPQPDGTTPQEDPARSTPGTGAPMPGESPAGTPPANPTAPEPQPGMDQPASGQPAGQPQGAQPPGEQTPESQRPGDQPAPPRNGMGNEPGTDSGAGQQPAPTGNQPQPSGKDPATTPAGQPQPDPTQPAQPMPGQPGQGEPMPGEPKQGEGMPGGESGQPPAGNPPQPGNSPAPNPAGGESGPNQPGQSPSGEPPKGQAPMGQPAPGNPPPGQNQPTPGATDAPGTPDPAGAPMPSEPSGTSPSANSPANNSNSPPAEGQNPPAGEQGTPQSPKGRHGDGLKAPPMPPQNGQPAPGTTPGEMPGTEPAGSSEGMPGESPGSGESSPTGQGTPQGQPPAGAPPGGQPGKMTNSGDTPASPGGEAPAGNEPGQAPGDSGMPGEGAGKGDAQPGDGMRGAGEAGQGEAGQGGKQPGQGEQGGGGDGAGGQPGEKGGPGGQPQPGQGAPGQPGGAPTGTAQTGAKGGGQGGAAGGELGAGNAGSGDSSITPDTADLDAKRRAADLALKRLQDQLQRGETPQELMDRLGFTEQDLQQFMQRLEQRLADQGTDQSPEAQAARRQFDALLKGSDYQSTGGRKDGGDAPREASQSFGTTNRPVPPEYRRDAETYRRRLSRQQ
jgi:hypothetical protein